MNFKDEVITVQYIGEQIGYGNLMTIASALWRIRLRNLGYSESGAFVPALRSDIKEGVSPTDVDRIYQLIISNMTPKNGEVIGASVEPKFTCAHCGDTGTGEPTFTKPEGTECPYCTKQPDQNKKK